MPTYRRLILVLLCCGLATTCVHAHFLFIRIVPDSSGKKVAEVYFSDTADAGDPMFIDKIADTKLWLQHTPGKFEPLHVGKEKDRLVSLLPKAEPMIVVGVCTYGVLPRKTPFLLRHFPKAMSGASNHLERLALFPKVPLEIIGKMQGEKLHIQAMKNGKPMPNAEIYTLAKDLSGGKLKCDKNGQVAWQPPRKGWYMVYTSDFKKQSGSYKGKQFQEIRDFATLSFEWPLQ